LTGVYVFADEKVALRQVRLGRTYDDNIEILAGLTEGERIATDPVAAGIYLKEQSTTVDGNE
jgi:multidrug efflux pump subunit AcrA (membrane-fusion protein)